MTLKYNNRSSGRYVPVRSDVWWNSIVMYMRTGTREMVLCDSSVACLVALRATILQFIEICESRRDVPRVSDDGASVQKIL